MDLFNGLLGAVQVTALHVTRLGNVTVAHMGTADGRILQVGPRSPPTQGLPHPHCHLLTAHLSQVELARSLNYLLYVSNFSLGSNGQPIQRDISRLGDHLLFTSGEQVRQEGQVGQAWEQGCPIQKGTDKQMSLGQGECGVWFPLAIPADSSQT